MEQVTPEMINDLRKVRDNALSAIQQAKGRLAEINKQIDDVLAEMAKHDLTPENAEAVIEERRNQLAVLYTQADELRAQIESVLNPTKEVE